MTADTDRELVRRVQRGDRSAFDLLFLRHRHKIHGLVSRFVRREEEIDDVVQESFIRAYRALPRFRLESAFYTWLYRIAINTAKNYLTAQNRRPSTLQGDIDEIELSEATGALTELGDPENEYLTGELEVAIRKALNALPDDLKNAVTFREFDGLSYEQIAEIMDCPVGTVRSRIFRAREAINKSIGFLISGD
ncbi:MAG: RNA polymerase sigma factor RpoE [Pseudomonadota bacterium]|nr:RNA polymerase sigma factor RpoE [Pseudomonadota bacterium]